MSRDKTYLERIREKERLPKFLFLTSIIVRISIARFEESHTKTAVKGTAGAWLTERRREHGHK